MNYRHNDNPPVPFYTLDNALAAAMHLEIKALHKLLLAAALPVPPLCCFCPFSGVSLGLVSAFRSCWFFWGAFWSSSCWLAAFCFSGPFKL